MTSDKAGFRQWAEIEEDETRRPVTIHVATPPSRSSTAVALEGLSSGRPPGFLNWIPPWTTSRHKARHKVGEVFELGGAYHKKLGGGGTRPAKRVEIDVFRAEAVRKIVNKAADLPWRDQSATPDVLHALRRAHPGIKIVESANKKGCFTLENAATAARIQAIVAWRKPFRAEWERCRR